MVRKDGRSRRGGARAIVVLGTFLLGAVLLAATPGCGTGSKEASGFAALFDRDSAVVIFEAVPPGGAGDGSAAAGKRESRDTEPCRQFVQGLLAVVGEGKEPEVSAPLRDAIGRVAEQYVGGKMFRGPMRYGVMVAGPADEAKWPSLAGLLVGGLTGDGAEALADLLDRMAEAFPDRVRAVAGSDPREWAIGVPALDGEVRVRLAPGQLRVAFGGGSLAAERDRLLAGTPAARPLEDPLPRPPLDPSRGGSRAWIRPEAAAGPVAETVRRLLAEAANPRDGGGGAAMMALEAVPGSVEELLGSFAAITFRADTGGGRVRVRLSGKVSPLVRLFHDREGSLAPGVLAGVPREGTFQAMAMLLPPLDRLAEAVIETASPDAAPMVKAQLDQPLPFAPGLTARKALAALGPELVTWRRLRHGKGAGDGDVPVPGMGMKLAVRDPQAIAAVLQAVGGFGGFGAPRRDGEITWWKVPGPGGPGAPGAQVLALGPRWLLVAPDEETARAALEGSGGIGADPAVADAVRRLAGGRPVGTIVWQDLGGMLRSAAEVEEQVAAGGFPATVPRLVVDMNRCTRSLLERCRLPGPQVGVGTRTEDGFRMDSTFLPPGGREGDE